MKTIIFVSNFLIEFVDFDLISDFRLVLLDTPQRRAKLPDDIAAQFSAIHLCTPEDASNPLSGITHESALAAVREELATAGDEVHVLSFFEFNLELSARLADELGLRTFQVPDYQRFRDKTIMKDIVASAGLRVPRYTHLDAEYIARDPALAFDALQSLIGLPFICKPIDAAGSVGVHRIDSREDFATFAHSGDLLRSDYEAEEFIDGTLFHCDFVIDGGKTVFRGCGEYFHPCFEASKGKIVGSLLVPSCDPEFGRIMGFASSCLSAFGVEFGAYHMEVFRKHSTGELVFLEVGARPPGLDASLAYRHLTGVSMPTLMLRSHLNLSVTPVEDYTDAAMWGQIPAKVGIIETLNTPDTECMVDVTYHRSVGDTLAAGFSYFDIVGKLQSPPQDYRTMRRDFEKIRTFSFCTLSAD